MLNTGSHQGRDPRHGRTSRHQKRRQIEPKAHPQVDNFDPQYPPVDRAEIQEK